MENVSKIFLILWIFTSILFITFFVLFVIEASKSPNGQKTDYFAHDNESLKITLLLRDGTVISELTNAAGELYLRRMNNEELVYMILTNTKNKTYTVSSGAVQIKDNLRTRVRWSAVDKPIELSVKNKDGGSNLFLKIHKLISDNEY